MNIVAGLIATFITMPIWFYLLYEILVRVNASELMWFLYWSYVPFTLFMLIVKELAVKEVGK